MEHFLMLVDPRHTLMATSIDTLIEECIETSSREEILENEIVIPCTKMGPFHSWNLGTVETFYNDETDEYENDRYGVYMPNEVFGNYNYIDPVDALKFTNATFDTVLALADSMIDGSELIAAGMLLTDGKGNYCNPLHPIVAQEILKKGKLPFDEFTIIFYPTREAEEIDRNSQIKKYILDLNDHIYNYRDTKDYSIQDIERFKKETLEKLEGLPYNEKISTEIIDENQPVYIITPVHVMDLGGVVYPYYGAIESYGHEGSQFNSINLYPMTTGNVRNSTNLDYAREETGEHEIQTNSEFDNTCIGKYSPGEWTNLKHMNIMNVQSMFVNEIISDDYKSHIYHSIKESTKILKKLKGKENGKKEQKQKREHRNEEVA